MERCKYEIGTKTHAERERAVRAKVLRMAGMIFRKVGPSSSRLILEKLLKAGSIVDNNAWFITRFLSHN